MASRKLTQLPTLTDPQPTDKVYVVDVSDTTESPQGTSKQIEIGDLAITSILSDTLTVTEDGGVVTVDGISGDFTPEPSDITGDATIDINSGFYYRSGDTCTMVFGIDVQLDAAELSTEFKFSLPIPSNFTNGRQMFLTSNRPPNLVEFFGSSNAAENKGSISVFGLGVGVAIQSLQVTATYKILS